LGKNREKKYGKNKEIMGNKNWENNTEKIGK
jgi:hypothetical protein